MNKITFPTCLILLFVLIFSSCKNDDDFTPNESTDETSLVYDEAFKSKYFGASVLKNFIGVITSTDGKKVSGANVTIGNTTILTDQNGVFVLNNVNVFENFAFIKVNKQGFINGSRVVIPKATGVTQLKIVLLENETIGSVISGEQSEVSLNNGAKVKFNGKFIDSNGMDYNGEVNVAMHYIAPNTQDTFLQMPGSLFAQTTENEAKLLETYGMVSINLFSPTGEHLNIDAESTAIIEYPIDDSQINIAPETITLWYFDEINGYWKEEGQAVKESNKYIAEVSHFTWWNCDKPVDLINFCFELSLDTSESTTSLSSFTVEIRRTANNQLIFSNAIFGNIGSLEECGFIPLDEEISIKILLPNKDNCSNEVIYENILGPYSEDTSVSINITDIGSVYSTKLTGTLNNCTGNPITNGYLIIDNNHIVSIINGDIDFTITHCIEKTVDFVLIDLDTNEVSNYTEIELNGNPVDIGVVSTCNAIGGIYNGDVILETQEQIDAFSLFVYTEVTGYLQIGIQNDIRVETNITDLSSLSSIVKVGGFVLVCNNQSLTSLQGLENITSLGDGDYGLNMYYNDGLASISTSDFQSLTTINGNLFIGNNRILESIEMAGFSTVSDLKIQDNRILTSVKLNSLITINSFHFNYNSIIKSIGEFNNLTTINNYLFLEFDHGLESLQGLNNLTSLGSIKIIVANGLKSLNGLENISGLTGDILIEYTGLTSLSGLDNLTSIQNVDLKSNQYLSNFCALQNVLTNGTVAGSLSISDNAFNPTTQDIIDGNCSQ